jgi:membrane-bound acyltransferase YfiQ involved in biofilm formation
MKYLLEIIVFIIVTSTLLCLVSDAIFNFHPFVFWGGIFPASVITSIVYLVVSFFFFKRITNKKLLFFVKISFLIILFLIIFTIIDKGGDLMYYLFSV